MRGTCFSTLARTSRVSASWQTLPKLLVGTTMSPSSSFSAKKKENGLHLMEAPSCLISVATFLSAMSLCLNCSSCLSCKLTRSVLKASESEENLFSMSRSDKLPALQRKRSQNLVNMDQLAQHGPLGTTWTTWHNLAQYGPLGTTWHNLLQSDALDESEVV